MKRSIHPSLLVLIGFGLLFLILAILVFSSQGQARPRYTLSNPRAAFIFENHDNFPCRVIREMCWNNTLGFACDERLSEDAQPFVLWLVTDWQAQKQGEIYQIGESYYWWMYQPEYGVDNQPHVAEHYWITCPE